MAAKPIWATLFLSTVTFLVSGMALPAAAQNLPSNPLTSARFSTLDEITVESVSNLGLAFMVRLPKQCGYSGTPQLGGHTLFVLTPFPHQLYAIQLAAPAAGSIRWTYAPPANPAAHGRELDCSGNHGPTVSGDAVYFNTLDGHTLSLAVETGTINWNVASADFNSGETLVSAPLVIGDAVIIGSAGDDFGARGWIKALDRATGEELWRKYSTGPDAEVGIDASFQPFYKGDRGKDLGLSSWPPSGWKRGGGGVSGLMSYDPETDLIFHGTGHPAPLNPDQRPGENKWTSGLFARDPKTGAARWFVQLNPHDLYGLGATAANIVADRDWDGAKRRLLIHPDSNGYVYVLDRGTGEILSTGSFGPVNATSGVDATTGSVRRIEAKAVHSDSTTRDVCPAAPGAISGGASAFSDNTGLLFIPATLLCMDLRPHDVSYIKGTPFTGITERLKPAPSPSRGALLAWDAATGTVVWTVPERFPIDGGVLATAGNLVFYGTLDGWFRAVDVRSGHIAWQYRVASQIASQPVSYRGPDGHQYVAALAGIGGPAGAVAQEDIDTLDATAAHGFASAVSDLPRPPDAAGMLYVFKLQ